MVTEDNFNGVSSATNTELKAEISHKRASGCVTFKRKTMAELLH